MMNKLKRIASKLLILFGVCSITFSAYLLISNLSTEKKAQSFGDRALTEIKSQQQIVKQNQNQSSKKEEIYFEGNLYAGVLTIPKLSLELPVQADWSFEKLYDTPCVYSEEPFIIAAHNYIVHFGNLTKLNQGDKVIFTDAASNHYNFELAKTEYIYETQFDKLYDDSKWDLTLYTCNHDNNVERIVLRFNLISITQKN